MAVDTHTQQVVRRTQGERATHLHWGLAWAFYRRLGFAFETFRRYLEQQDIRP
jgi:hypothetical protein